MTTVLCVIPARAGSQRIPRKNWVDLHGFNLVEWADTAALDSEICTRIVVSSDSNEWPGLDVIKRPEHLSGPEIDISSVVRHALMTCENQDDIHYDHVITLQPATPLRNGALVKAAYTNMRTAGCNSALTLTNCVPWTWELSGNMAVNGWSPGPYPRSQNVKTKHFQEVNTVQITDRHTVLQEKRWQLPLCVTELPNWATLDIDTPRDLDEVRRLWPMLKSELDIYSNFPSHLITSINGRVGI